MVTYNGYDQEIGDPVPNWAGSKSPQRIVLKGKYCRLEPLSVEIHGLQLFEAFTKAKDDRMWTYLPIGPFKNYQEYENIATKFEQDQEAIHYAVITKENNRAVGSLSLMRADVLNGTIEIGYVMFSIELQKTTASTEAQYLLMKYVFDGLCYRRCEWKCDRLNAPSRSSALRLGFLFEGTFRNAAVYKGRSRDTQWFSVIDTEWLGIRKAFELWLRAENFTKGKQHKKLSEFRSVIKELENARKTIQ
ncbi:LAQU0S45e00100g1_1 [Lachancea quebecensis]|uniref:LAQU0S45e00100g1_1 n=1 Tax=Lachancea quebecensis TaxID=1654605 RepID=A0A0P1KYN0_9SACH|nr:LAQU0S45e00100g1_1 [Lachancea quebecensis]